MTLALFLYFGGMIVVASLLVVLLRNPVYSAVALLVMFFHVAGLYVLLNAEFIAVIQVIVYAGAILVLYLFVLMLLNLKSEERYHRGFWIGLGVGLALLVEVVLILFRSRFSATGAGYPVALVKDLGNTQVIGRMLYTEYLLPFEVASLLLLVAMIGAIVLSKRGMLRPPAPPAGPPPIKAGEVGRSGASVEPKASNQGGRLRPHGPPDMRGRA